MIDCKCIVTVRTDLVGC